ncbi:unnamed protein product [Ceutorhynchus assimilis]|uniref:Uncharacterized protein n=1 Tax=Ceutorhynchus assimilis TaxID=467358 RepID=A0A9N9MUJ8_9CUCU|nr:unnamed protein product [Ceutorhynchus assimilis]
MRSGFWKYVLLLVAVAAYCSGGNPSVPEQGQSQNFNFLVEVVRQDTKERVAVGTLLSPTRVLTSPKALDFNTSGYEVHVTTRHKERFIISSVLSAMGQGALYLGASAAASTLGNIIVNHFKNPPYDDYLVHLRMKQNRFKKCDIAILTIKPTQPVSRADLTFVELSSKSSRALDKEADTPCKKASVLGWKERATVDLIGTKKCAEKINIQSKGEHFCSLNEENLFCDSNQQGSPVMCGDLQVGMLIPGRYCYGTENNLPGEPLQFVRIEDYIDGIAKAMEPREDEKPLPNDNSTVPTPTTVSEGICFKPYTNIFVLLWIAILLYIFI